MRVPLHFTFAASLVLVLGCDASKTSSSLAPTVAGPQAGVSITAPRPVSPSADFRFVQGIGPLVLIVENSTTTGQRPIVYTFEIATDTGFSDVIRSKTDVPAGANGRTEWTVADAPPTGRTYHWRARAGDGANVSPYSDVVRFLVSEPIVLHSPNPISPTNSVTTSSMQPVLRTANADRSGPAAALVYDFELATVSDFQSLVLAREVQEGNGSTELAIDQTLDPQRTYFWRVRAREASVTGPWSGAATFKTPTPGTQPAPIPPPLGTGVPSASEGLAMVIFVKEDLQRRGIPIAGDCGAFEITKRVAWAFRDRGAGLEKKPTGRNCDGYSQDIVLFPGLSIDILIGGGVDNGPSWQVHDWPEWASLWAPPFNPDGGGPG